MNRELRISNMLKDLGIAANLSGYTYLKKAIDMVMDDPSLIHHVTKDIYPSMAQEFKTTYSRVERAVRHSIQVGWQKGNKQTQDELFGYTVSSDRGHPTSSEFIATIADYIIITQED